MLLTSSSWFSRWRGTSKQPDVQVQEELGRAAVPVNGEEDNSEDALTAAAQGGLFAARDAVEQREWHAGKRTGSRMCVVNHCTELRETICMCPEHARALVVLVQGVESRFCQVCKRPQPLSDFIRANRTCTRVLESKRAKRWRKKMQKQRDPGVQSCSASSKLAAAETPQFAEAAHQVQQRNPFALEEGVGVSAGFHQLGASSSGALQHALQHAFSRPPPSQQQQPDHTEMNSIWDSAEIESDIWDSTGGTESSIWDSAGTESEIWDSTGGVTENNNNNIIWDSNEGSAENTNQRMLNSTRRPINAFAAADTQRATYVTQAEIQHHNPNTQNLTTGVVQSMAALWSTDSNSSMIRPMNAFAPADMAAKIHNPTHLTGMDHSMAGCPQPPRRWSTTSPDKSQGREFSPEPMEPMFAKSSIDYHPVADLEAISVKVQQQKTAYLQQQQQRTAYLQQHVDRAQTANVPPASWFFDNKALPSAAMSHLENATVASSMDVHQHQASNGFVPTPNTSLLRRLAFNDLTW